MPVYQPPGIYISEQPQPLAGPVGLASTLVALVGPSIGYRIFTDAVTLSGVSAASLSQEGINTASISVRGTDGTNYVGSDWTAVATGSPPTSTTTIQRQSLSNIPDGTTVLVTYQYTDTTYFQPQNVGDYSSVVLQFGQPFDINGNIVSPLTLAAKIAFDNGAVQLVCLATPSSPARSDFASAYNLLLAEPAIDIIIPLPIGITGSDNSSGDVDGLGTDLRTFLVNQAVNNEIYQVALLSYDTSVTRDPKQSASIIANGRVMLIYPYQVQYFNGLNNQMLVIGGCYLAAAFGGVLSAQRFQDPLTHKQVTDFAGFPPVVQQALTGAAKNAMAQVGVAVVERTRAGVMRMMHGLTTDVSSLYTRELSLVRTQDAMIQEIIQTFDVQGLIGTPIDPETPARLMAVTQGCLNTSTNAGVINGYNSVSVTQDTTDPTIMFIKFQYLPAYPLNYVDVVFSVNTTTGSTSVQTGSGG